MRSWTTAVAVTALAVSLAACGDDGAERPVEETPVSHSPSHSETPTPSQTPTAAEEERTVVSVSIEGDRITPGGERIEVDRDEVVTLEITSDRAGELHVHSKPEQFVEFEAGTSVHELVIGAPGVVDVEEHESGHVVVQLEVH